MLSQGPFSYNRFDEMDAIYQKVYESKKAKPDFLDVDKDGNKKESFKKAVKDDKASDKSVEESDDKKDLPPFMKDKKDDKKGDKKDKCDCKEDVIGYLMHEGFANNSVSAEVLFNHMSDQWLESIEEGFMPLPKEKMARQANKAYGKEQSAASAGNEKEANKQMQRRIAMKDPSGRKVALGKG